MFTDKLIFKRFWCMILYVRHISVSFFKEKCGFSEEVFINFNVVLQWSCNSLIPLAIDDEWKSDILLALWNLTTRRAYYISRKWSWLGLSNPSSHHQVRQGCKSNEWCYASYAAGAQFCKMTASQILADIRTLLGGQLLLIWHLLHQQMMFGPRYVRKFNQRHLDTYLWHG